MKSLNLEKPLIIMMVGLPGAGKSFFAKRFAEGLGVPMVSVDRMRFELFANPEFSTEEQQVISRIADYQIEELLKTNQTFLVDGNCSSKVERQQLRSLARKAGYGTLIVWVQTHEATARSRATRRSNKLDDKYNPSLTPEQFTAFSRRFTNPGTGENYVVISGMHTYSTQVKVVLRKLLAHRQVNTPNTAEKPAEQSQNPNRIGMRRNVIIR